MSREKEDKRIDELTAKLRNVAKKVAVNPFVNGTIMEWRMIDYVKAIVVLPILLPIRVCLLVTCALLALLFAKLSRLGLPPPRAELKPKPLSRWRRLVLSPVALFLRLALFAFGFHWVEQRGSPDPRASVIVANHTSFFDPLYLVSQVLGSPVSRLSNAHIPVVGVLLAALQPILVDRADPNSRTMARQMLEERAKLHAESPAGTYSPVIIFPEGTTTNGKALCAFKSGGFVGGAVVQPVIIRFPFQRCDLSWVGTLGMVQVALRALTQLHNRITVDFLPAHVPTADECANPRLYAENVRREMAAAGSFPITDHGYEDVLLQLDAIKLGLQADDVDIEFGRFHREFADLSLDSLKEFLAQFAAVDKDRDGKISIDEFASALSMPVTPSLRALFQLIDRDDSGELSYLEWCSSMSFFVAKDDEELDDALRFAFDAIDIDNNGSLSFDEVCMVLQQTNPMHWTKERAAEMFDAMDKNHDRSVSFDEFASFFANPIKKRLLLWWTRPDRNDLFVDSAGHRRASASSSSSSK